MVEIGESSFTYLQIFYSLDYDIPLPSYKSIVLGPSLNISYWVLY